MAPKSPKPERPSQPVGSTDFSMTEGGGVDGGSVATAAADSSGVLREGQILKRGYRVPTKKTWNKRYFVLRENNVLSYWASQKDYVAGGKPRGSVALAQDCSVGGIYISIRKGKKGSSGEDGYEDSGDETASEESELLPPTASALTREGSKRSAYRSKAASKLRSVRKRGKEQLYCFKISWLETSSAKGNESAVSSGSRGPPAIVGDVTPSFDSAAPMAMTNASSSSAAMAAPRSPPQASMRITEEDDEHSRSLLGTDLVSEGNASVDGFGGATPPLRRPQPLNIDDIRASNSREAGAVTLPPMGRPPRAVRASSAPGTPRVQSPLTLPLVTAGAAESAPFSPGGQAHGVMSPIPPRPTGGMSGTRLVGGGASADEDDMSVGTAGGITGATSMATGSSTPLKKRTMTADAALAVPLIAGSQSGDEHDDFHNGAVVTVVGGEEGIQKHYAAVVSQQQKVSQEKQQEMMRVMFLSSKHAAKKKNTKRIVRGSKVAAAAGAAVTAGVLTAGVGLAVGLVFVGITAAAGGGGAMAEANYLRTKGKTSMTVACLSLEEAQAWKAALEAAIRGERPNGQEDAGGGSNDLWSALFAKDGSTIPGAGARVRGMMGLAEQVTGGQQTKTRGGADGKGGDLGVAIDPETSWRPLEGGWVLLLGCGAHGLRIFREDRADAEASRALRRRQVSVEGGTCPPLRAHITLGDTPLNAFMCLMSQGRTERDISSLGGDLNASTLAPNSCQRASFRIIETVDDHMDIIHLFFRPLYLFPSWTAPRDYVLFRYWRYDPDGSYMICLDSVAHEGCSPVEGYVRGEMHSVFTIAPRKASRSRKGGGGNHGQAESSECLLTSLVQVDPKGWVPTAPISPLSNQSYADAFGVSALMQLLDVKDALDHDRFVPVSMDAGPLNKSSWKVPGIEGGKAQQRILRRLAKPDPKAAGQRGGLQGSPSMDYDDDDEDDRINYDFAFSSREMPHDHSEHISVAATEPGMPVPGATFTSFPETCLPQYWAEPDADAFRLRGKLYKTDRKKYNAGESIMRLVAVDIVETPENIMTGMCSHPAERVQQSMARGDLPAFVFAVNIALPGPPCFHMVYYYAVDDISKVDGTDGTPSSKLANEFFFGDSDEFRDKTFKLIPQIVEGNFMVRKAVGCTPCIMGTKLKQHHLRDPSPKPRYFELLLDTGSDPVAKGVIRLCLGYAKTIVVDMAFLLEGNDESTLPERVMGCARLKEMVFTNLREVEMPNLPTSTYGEI